MNVLVICLGNTCRSPMAGGLLRKIAHSRGVSIDVRTAGLLPHLGERVAKNAVTVMAELGVDISDEYSKPVTAQDLRWTDKVLAVQRDHAEHLREDFPDAVREIQFLGDDVPDPYLGPVAEYRKTRDVLQALLSRWVDSLRPPSS